MKGRCSITFPFVCRCKKMFYDARIRICSCFRLRMIFTSSISFFKSLVKDYVLFMRVFFNIQQIGLSHLMRHMRWDLLLLNLSGVLLQLPILSSLLECFLSIRHT